jgi:hypothetical protein
MKVTKRGARCCIGLEIATVFLLSIQAVAQTGSARSAVEVDLKPLGAQVPRSGEVSRTSIEILFLSDNDLILLDENNSPGGRRDAELVLCEIGSGIARPKKMITLDQWVLPISVTGPRSERVLEWIDAEHFAYWTYLSKARRWLCDSNLNCREDKEETVAVPLPHAGNCEPAGFLGYVNAREAACLVPGTHARSSVVVTENPGGRRLYEVEHEALPWDAQMVNSVKGSRFGLVWESNTFLQRLNPSACIDECPPAGRQEFAVFDSTDGRKLRNFEWDPRPYNLYVLPALSPSGKTAALVRADKLVIYPLD